MYDQDLTWSGLGNYHPVDNYSIGNEIANQLTKESTTLHQHETFTDILIAKIVLRTTQDYNEEQATECTMDRVWQNIADT